MTREEIITKVNSLLAEEFEIEESEFAPDANLKDTLNLDRFEIEESEFAPDENLKDTLNLDSINLVDLIALVQFNYKVTIPVEDLKKIQTFNNLYDYIFEHQAA